MIALGNLNNARRACIDGQSHPSLDLDRNIDAELSATTSIAAASAAAATVSVDRCSSIGHSASGRPLPTHLAPPLGIVVMMMVPPVRVLWPMNLVFSAC